MHKDFFFVLFLFSEEKIRGRSRHRDSDRSDVNSFLKGEEGEGKRKEEGEVEEGGEEEGEAFIKREEFLF